MVRGLAEEMVSTCDLNLLSALKTGALKISFDLEQMWEQWEMGRVRLKCCQQSNIENGVGLLITCRDPINEITHTKYTIISGCYY